MTTTIIIRRGTAAPTQASGLTLGEPAFNTTDQTLHIGRGAGVTAAWVGARITGLSADIASGLTLQIPTSAAVKNYVTDYVSANTSGVSRLSVGGSELSGIVTLLGGSQLGITSNGTNNITFTNNGVRTLGLSGDWKKSVVAIFGGSTGALLLSGATWGSTTVTNAGNVGGIGNGTNLAGRTVFDILESLLFSFQSSTVSWGSVSTFTSGTLELGQTAANSGNATITTSAGNTSNIDANGFSVVYSHNNTSAPAGSASDVSFLGATAYAASKTNINLATAVRGTTVGANFTFTARVSDYNAWVAYGSPLPTSLGETATAAITATWYSKMYWGQTTGSSITARSQLTGEQSRFVTQTAANYTFNLANAISWTPPTDRQSYLYILIKDDYWTTDPSFFDQGNFPFGFARQASPTTITLTNDQGFASTYRVYRSASTFNSNMSLYAQ